MAGIDGQVKQEELDAQREVLRRLALGQVRQYPDPVLRMRANEVAAFDAALESLAERLGRLMHDAGGVGLAAPQIGVLQRVFVYEVGQDSALLALVNPVIVGRSGRVRTSSTSCRSARPSSTAAPKGAVAATARRTRRAGRVPAAAGAARALSGAARRRPGR